MTYQPNIPTGTVKLNQDYASIRDNFTVTNTAFLKNHTPLTDNSGIQGLHTHVDMPQQTKPTIASGQGSLYCNKSTPNPTPTNLFYTADGSAGGITYQLTRVGDPAHALFGNFVNNYQPNGTGPAVGVNFTGGWTFLPGAPPTGPLPQGGLIMNYGRAKRTSNLITIDYPVTLFHSPYYVSVTPVTASLTNTQFFAVVSASASQIVIASLGYTTSDFFSWSVIGN